MTKRRQRQSGQQFPISRRGVLRAGLLGFGGLNLANLLRHRAAASPAEPKDTSVIFLFLHGGPSQLETYDRGLDQKVLVIAAGEFGRTPKGTLQPGTSTGKLQWGRDHWPGAQSIEELC